MALYLEWMVISSSGMYLHDNAVRNLSCDKPEPIADSNNAAMGDTIEQGYGKAIFSVRCSYEVARVDIKNREGRGFPSGPRVYSQAELENIPAAQWKEYDSRLLHYMLASRYSGAHWMMAR